MNLVLKFLERNWQRLELKRFGDPARLSCVMMTPRFRASSHVICFILTEGKTEPIFVVKLPRLPGDHSRLDREAANLRAANHNRAENDFSIPRVLAYEDYHQHRLLIETAVPGRTMSPAVVRRQPESCTEITITWLTNLQLATMTHGAERDDWFARLIDEPFLQFKKILRETEDVARLADETVGMMKPLRNHGLPLVMSHEDFSPPNILQTENGDVGVVDWELAQPNGLPASDLFFFLTYIAFARNGARKNEAYLKAFHQAFFNSNAWARPYVERYCEGLKLSQEMLAPLFVATWGRYVAGLIARLQEGAAENQKIDQATLKWLKTNRYYQLWKYAIENINELSFVS
jgi:aminoglycoside phosphotransferase (APT) family kinase protein